MESGILLGIDHGGTTTTAIAVDPSGRVLSSASVLMPKRAPGLGLVEHDPEDFVRTSLASAGNALDRAGLKWQDVAAVGIANQGETSMAWSAEKLLPLGPAISWEDRRTATYCASLVKKGVDELVRRHTGIVLDPYFSASKFHWLSHENPDARIAAKVGDLRLGGTDAYVIGMLTKGAVHATEPGTGSRTALMSIRDLNWNGDLVRAFEIDPSALPAIRSTVGVFGEIDHPDVPAHRIAIRANVVDAHAALFAQGCWDPTCAKATYGTGAFIEVNSGTDMLEPDGAMPIFVAWRIGDRVDYTIEGSVFSVGAAIEWAIKIGLIESAAKTAELALSVPDSGGVVFVPSFTGLSAPYWRSSARAVVSGLGLDTTNAHVARALLDGIAFSCVDVIQALNQRLGGVIAALRCDGGPTQNAYLMQRQADLLGIPVDVAEEQNMTALGAALLAGVGSGHMNLEDVKHQRRPMRTYVPRLSADQRESEHSAWRTAMRAILEVAAT